MVYMPGSLITETPACRGVSVSTRRYRTRDRARPCALTGVKPREATEVKPRGETPLEGTTEPLSCCLSEPLSSLPHTWLFSDTHTTRAHNTSVVSITPQDIGITGASHSIRVLALVTMTRTLHSGTGLALVSTPGGASQRGSEEWKIHLRV